MIVEDRTTESQETEQLREQLTRAQRLAGVGTLAAGVAHELNNILTIVLNQARLGLRDHANDEDRRAALSKILTNGQRASVIINSMLGFVRESPGGPKKTEVVKLIEDVLHLVEKDLRSHRVQVVRKFHDHPEAMLIGPQIEQVLVNLILNARQAMPNGGSLTIEVRESAETNMVEIRVADSGGGIAPEKLRVIFEPFYTTKEPDGEGQGGTGLGLSICRRIIEHHHGRIRVESMVGKGTAFTLKLPLEIASSPR